MRRVAVTLFHVCMFLYGPLYSDLWLWARL